MFQIRKPRARRVEIRKNRPDITSLKEAITDSRFLSLVAVVANLLAAIHLFHDILTNNKLFAGNATGLLATGGVIWATNVIAFALWYWDLDRGGAAARAHHPQANPAFIFPEMLHTQYVPATWVPKFVDYLSLGFWTATAFSPTDVSAIRPWAKLLMITEAAVSLGIAGLVIARAINILA